MNARLFLLALLGLLVLVGIGFADLIECAARWARLRGESYVRWLSDEMDKFR